MTGGGAKLSRRALLAGACAAPAAAALPSPLLRHPELGSGSSSPAAAPPPDGIPAQVRPDAQGDERWARALSAYAAAEAALEALAHTGDDDLYDSALARHGAALEGVMLGQAPDLAGVARKLALFARFSVFESGFGEAAVAAVRRDVERLARRPG